MGWGAGYTGGELVPIFQAISNAQEVHLDRWNVLFDVYRKCTSCQTRDVKHKNKNNQIGKEFLSSDRNDESFDTNSSAEREIYTRKEKIILERQQTTTLYESLRSRLKCVISFGRTNYLNK